MDEIVERRKSPRVYHKATVTIDNRNADIFYYATMHKFSGDGIFCGSDYALSPGTIITIRLDKMPFRCAPQNYLGEVRLCQELEGDYNTHIYGFSIKIIEALSG